MISIKFRLTRPLVTMPYMAGLACVAMCLLLPSASLAHEGHDHDDAAREILATTIYPRVVAQSEQYEAVGILKAERLSIYLDRYTTNAPISDAVVNVTIGNGDAIDAKPAGDGTYTVPSPGLTGPGSVEVIFSISAEGGDDLLVGVLKLPDPATQDQPPIEPATRASPSWTASIPGPIRNPIVLALVTFGLGMLFGRLHRNGRILPAVATGSAAAIVLIILVDVVKSGDPQPESGAGNTPRTAMSDAPRRLPDGSAFVAKPTQRLLEVATAAVKPGTLQPAINLIGRVIADPNHASVVQSIHGGRVISLENGLPHVGQRVRQGDVLAHIDPNLPLADRTTISEKAGEIDQLIAVVEARLNRIRPLAERGVVPQSQITDAETELEGLRLRRQTIRNTRAEREVLRAPTNGVISIRKVIPGQVVQAQDVLFEIIDPERLWIEALGYENIDPNSLVDATAAVAGGPAMRLAHRGFSRTLQQHASVVQFAIIDPPPNLSIGQPVTVSAKNGAPVTGLVVSRNAVVRSGNGGDIAWLHVSPERFEARPVRIQPFDANRLVIAAGVEGGERIVTRAADLINQVR